TKGDDCENAEEEEACPRPTPARVRVHGVEVMKLFGVRQDDVEAVYNEFNRGIETGDYSAFQIDAQVAEATRAIAAERGWGGAYAWKVYKKAHKKVMREMDAIWDAVKRNADPQSYTLSDAAASLDAMLRGADDDALRLAYENLIEKRGADSAPLLALAICTTASDPLTLVRSLHAAARA